MRAQRCRRRGSTLLALLLLYTLSPANPADAGSGTRIPKKAGARAKETSGEARRRAAALRVFSNRWLGTSYRWGGNAKSGIDCSAYARQMYRDVFKLELPRTTSQQIHMGQGVPLAGRKLGAGFEPGDLFFYVDRGGVPNHVVVYLGDGMFSHSASGRGVVVEGFKALWGRRIVGRRVLVPGGSAASVLRYVPAAEAPEVAFEVPCPKRYRAQREHVRRYRNTAIAKIRDLGLAEICEFKALKSVLEKRPGPASKGNVSKIDKHIEWLESIEALKGEIDEGW